MTFEKFKTILLNALVLVSIFLTYQLWTFQPDYEQLDHLETVEKVTLGSERELNEVIQPFQVLFHFEGKHAGTYNLHQFKDVYQRLLDGSYKNLRKQSLDFAELNRLRETNKSVEFIYPNGFEMEVYKHLFDFNGEESRLPEVDRILLFEQVGMNDNINTKVWFISYDKQKYVEAHLTNVSFSKYEDWYNENLEALLELEKNTFQDEQPPVYFPNEAVQAYQYQAAYPVPFPELDLTKALFPDPTVVRQSYLDDGILSYTDGSRELKLFTDANYLTYINPTRSGEQTVGNPPAALQAYHFVNNHGGFTEPFLLSRIKKLFGVKMEIVFQQIFNGYLTFDARIGRLDVIWQNTEVFEYSRSTQSFKTSVVYEEPGAVELPSSEEIKAFFAQSDHYDLNNVENITLGYTMNEHEDYVVFSPNWYFLYDGNWEALLKEDEERA